MILKQGFHAHPKTVMLRNRGGSAAVEALQQLWLFAENARAWQFPNWSREFVAAIGSIYGEPDLADLLLEVGFLDAMPSGGFELHDFEEHNAALIQRWENGRFGKMGAQFGKLGGRPRNPRQTPDGGYEKPPVGGPKNPPTRPDQTRPGNTLGETPPPESNGHPVLNFEADGASAKPKRPASDEEWLTELGADPTYAGVDVVREFGKLTRWCQENHKQPTRRRFVNWLNRADRAIQASAPQGRDLPQARQDLANLKGASPREKQAPDYKTRLAQAETRVARLEGRIA